MTASDSDEDSRPLSSSEDLKLTQAAAIIVDAFDGLARPVPNDSRSAQAALSCRNRVVALLRIWSFLGLLTEFCVEPQWCSKTQCQDKEHYYMSQVPKFNRRSSQMVMVRAVYIFPYVIDVSLLLCAYGKKIFTDVVWSVYAACVAAYLTFCVASYVHPLSIPAIAFLRAVIFVVFKPSVAKQLMIMVRSLPEIAELLFLGFLLMCFFAWVALVLFAEGSEERDTFFPSFQQGLWSMLVLLTTANFPDVMLPAYRQNRGYVLFFFLFLLIGMFFLVNMVTAIVMNAYNRQVESEGKNRVSVRQEKLTEAYNLLTEEENLNVDRMQEALGELSQHSDFAHVKNLSAMEIDTSSDGIISLQEFAELLGLLNTKIKSQMSPPFLEMLWPELAQSTCWQRAKQFVQSDKLAKTIDLILFVNLMLMVIHTWPLITGTGSNSEVRDEIHDVITTWKQNFFTLIFICEALAKIALLGWDRYIAVHTNQFDFAITLTIAVTSFIIWCPYIPFDDGKLVRVVASARLFRIFRLLNHYQPYHDLDHIAFILLPTALDILMVLGLLCYVFSVIGVMLFGGVINQDPHSPYYAVVAASSFGQANYYPNNFNDFGMGVVTLFELLVVNNWFVIADGFSAACGVWARVYFVTFYVMGVLVGLNLVVSFIIGAFIDEYETGTLRKSSETQAELEEAEFQIIKEVDSDGPPSARQLMVADDV